MHFESAPEPPSNPSPFRASYATPCHDGIRVCRGDMRCGDGGGGSTTVERTGISETYYPVVTV
jgi:hypothetical protein